MNKFGMRDLNFSFREDMTCPYIEDDRTASLEFILPADLLQNFHQYLAAGYRRLGSVLYRNACRSCSLCLPIRLEAKRFKASKSQRRTLRRNSDVRVECRAPSITPCKIELYSSYIASKHPTGGEDDIRDSASSLSSLHLGYSGSIEMDYFLGEKLIAVGIVDEGADALSSTYFYYDTAYLMRRPGIFSILQEISLALSLGKKYYYLGFCIEETSKMSYKKFFRPNQVLKDGEWKDYPVRMKRLK
jgi:arginyl-tRNA--protein-N-Asp/Glu arginylyltransferase